MTLPSPLANLKPRNSVTAPYTSPIECGKLTFFRVYSGVLKSGSHVHNSTKNRKERIGRLLQMHANKREEIGEIFSGDIVACVGLRNVTTGDSVCEPKRPIILEPMDFPEPVLSVAIEPKTKADQEKLSNSLAKLVQEDPTFRVNTDSETGQTLISGMGELHLEILVDRLIREFGVGANVGKPQVAYKETMTEMIKKNVPPERLQVLLSKTLFKRFITPEDVGAACVYLASKEADNITGQIMYIDGGLTAIG